MNRRSVILLVALATAAQVSPAALGQEWTRFRGPNGTGVARAANLPAEWSEEDYNWAVELPGLGHSSPVIWGDKIFLMSATDEGAKRLVLCLSTVDGRLLWSREYASTPHKKHLRNSFASSTPAVDEERVYVCWTDPESYLLIALDHDGNEIWRQDLGPFESQHSGGTSPIVFEDLVVLNNDQDGESYLVAFDRATGEVRWKTPRETAVVAYSTPCVFQQGDDSPPELIFNSQAHGISSIDPRNGHTNWELDVFDKRSVSSPVVAGGLIFGSCGSGAGGNYVVAVWPGSPSGEAAPQLAYKIDKSAPYVPTPVHHNGLVFLWSDKGIVTCIDAAGGDLVWQKRVGNNFSGSPILVGDWLYCIADDGEVFVLAASENYQELGRTQLGEEARSTPAVSDGVMYLRTVSHLYSLGGKNTRAPAQAGQ